MARIEDSAGEDNSFKHCYKGKKKEKCHIGKDAVSRERFFLFVLGSVLWFFFLNTWNLFLSIALSYPSSVCFMPHVAGILDL